LEPGGWVLAFAGACGALLAWALQLELRGGRRRWRLAALVAAAVCLFLLAARPARMAGVGERSAIVVTPRAVEEEVASLSATGGTFAIDGASSRLAGPVRDIALLVRDRGDVTHWQVAGVGLPPWDLDALPGRVSFAAPASPGTGIARVTWPRELTLGDDLRVAGSASTGERGGTLELLGPGGSERVVELAPGASSFELRARPRREGRWLYRLALSVDGARVATEVVDVLVGRPSPPAVLWLEGAPSFETRHLKSWLRDLGGAMVVRSQVSRGRYRFEFLNHERVDVSRLTRELLSGFDAAVVDGSAWRALPRTERATLLGAVAEGLGLLRAPVGEASLAGSPFENFEVADLADLDEREVRAYAPVLQPLPPLVIPARHLVRAPGQRTLLRDAAGRGLAALERRDLGTIAVSVMEGTYRWVLRGEPAAHRSYWSHLLAAISRPRAELVDWRLPSGPILVDEPLEVSLLATAPWSVTVADPTGEELPLPTARDVVEPRLWRGVLRPRRAGWHQLAAGDRETWFYAQERDSWSAWRERRAFAATARRAILGRALTSEGGLVTLLRPWHPGWFLAVLVMALAALWADEQWRPAGGSG
jgi:hypothetical protein